MIQKNQHNFAFFTLFEIKATPHNYRLTALCTSNLLISRHLAQKLLEIRKYYCVVSIQSDEKFSALSAHNSCAVLP